MSTTDQGKSPQALQSLPSRHCRGSRDRGAAVNTLTSLTPEALAELRRLLDAANHARDVYEVNEDDSRGYSVETWDEWSIATCAGEQWAQLIAAAVNALPDLLDAAAVLPELLAANPTALRQEDPR